MNQALAAATETAPITLPAIGAPLGGGFFTGTYQIDGKRFALITAGAAGELHGKWNGDLVAVDGATHRSDGLANTRAMAAAGSDLAQQAMALTINGFSDWAIPSRDEQEMQYRAFKPTGYENYADSIDGVNPSSLPVGEAYTEEFPAQTTVENFREGGADALAADWYWSSEQHAGYPTDAWSQIFVNGFQYNYLKSYAGAARAVRRLPI